MTIIRRIALYGNMIFIDHMQGGNNGIDMRKYSGIEDVLAEAQRRLNEPLTDEMRQGIIDAWDAWRAQSELDFEKHEHKIEKARAKANIGSWHGGKELQID